MSDEATNNTTPKRLDRIETKVDSLELRVVGVEKDLAHRGAILELQLAAFGKGQDALSLKLDTLSNYLTKAQIDSAAMLGDPRSTVAGRQVMDRLDEIEKATEAVELRTRNTDKKIAYAAGAVGVAVLIIELLAPTVLRIIFSI